MEININHIRDNFEEFVSSFEKFNEPHLISFVFPVEKYSALPAINHFNQFSDDIFFFQSPNSTNSIVGINSALEFKINDVFTPDLVYDEYKRWKNKLIDNWREYDLPSLPIISSAFKFDQLKLSEQWNDFPAIRIYIPEFIFFKQKEKYFCCYNLISEGKLNLKQIGNLFESKLKTLISNLKNTIKSSESISSDLSSEDEKTGYWKFISDQALQVLDTNNVEKLVISRPYEFSVNTDLDWSLLLTNLHERFPDCYLFFIRKKKSVFFGSSPEMFLKVSDNSAEVESIAGSAARSEILETDRALEKNLQANDKNHREHQYVSEFISEVLKKYSYSIRITEEKQVKKLDNIQHLITRISADLKKGNLFALIDSLFPTPAVCGVPKNSAMSFIRKLELHDRGLYSGLVGWFDFNDNCELAVSIRSALHMNNQVTAFAGAGLVKNSNPDEEYQETKLKLDPILSLFNFKIQK
jgi:menaquinone-specific isochorismate synthase